MNTSSRNVFYVFCITFITIFSSCTKKESEPASEATSIDLLWEGEEVELSGDEFITGDQFIPGDQFENIEVLIKDQFGNPMAETIVHFSVTQGSIEPSSALTDARGIASTTWTLGDNLQNQNLIIRAYQTDGETLLDGAPLTITAILESQTNFAESISLVSGDNQTGVIGNTLIDSIVVLVKDANDSPFEGAELTFTPYASEFSYTKTSDENGLIATTWTLANFTGTQTLKVEGYKLDGTTHLTGSPLEVTANASNIPVYADSLVLVSGNNQSGTINTALSNPIVVQVLDQFDNPFEGHSVNILVNDGSVSNSSITTDANGLASINWTLGDTVGTQNITLESLKADGTTPLENPPMLITANGTNVAPYAESLVLVSGNNQSATINTALANPVVVKVLDQFDNPFEGHSVNILVNDGSVSNSSITTDANGLASINWTLGDTVGAQTISAMSVKADGTTPLEGSPMTLTANAQAALGADILLKISGDNQTGTVSTTLENPIVVRVLDQFENPFAGVTVTFTPSNGSVSAQSVQSDSNGNATVNWTLGSTIGTQTLAATAFKADGTTPLSGAPITFISDAQAALSADILLRITDNQSGTINTTLANPIVVRVLDQFENPFAGATVTFTPVNGSVSAQTVVSDASGEAQTSWTLGSQVTDQQLIITAFKADGTTPLTGSPISYYVSASAPLAVGDFHEGGIIFYLDNTGEHGLVCAITDQAAGASWGCVGTPIAGADGTAIGTGAQNTLDILADCQESLIAAEWCSSLNMNGYSDWFLPSQDELSELFSHKAIIDAQSAAFGGTALQTNFYWSSTEINDNQAWGYNIFGDDFKTNIFNVRAIRAF